MQDSVLKNSALPTLEEYDKSYKDIFCIILSFDGI